MNKFGEIEDLNDIIEIFNSKARYPVSMSGNSMMQLATLNRMRAVGMISDRELEAYKKEYNIEE